MQDLTKYTKGQKEALLDSLKNQKSPFTPAERKLYKELKKECINIVSADYEGVTIQVERKDNKVRLIDIDTFGEDYRNGWLKVRETYKGEYFVSQYLGGQRVYLK